MRQNHPETSLIPSHITPNHIPELFLGGDFSPQVPKKRLSPQPPPKGTRHLPALQNYQNLHGTIMCDPKTRLRGPCGPASAWMLPTVSQDTTQSVWGPTMGSPGHPGSGKIEKTVNFTHSGVPEKNTNQKAPKNAPKNARTWKFRKIEAVSIKKK